MIYVQMASPGTQSASLLRQISKTLGKWQSTAFTSPAAMISMSGM